MYAIGTQAENWDQPVSSNNKKLVFAQRFRNRSEVIRNSSVLGTEAGN
jgi:hypothetical protein